MTNHGKPVGPLHGLPISVKNHIGMKGLGYNCAFVAWVGTVAEDDALLLKILWKAGCVFYARTTEPQTMVSTPAYLYTIVPRTVFKRVGVTDFRVAEPISSSCATFLDPSRADCFSYRVKDWEKHR